MVFKPGQPKQWGRKAGTPNKTTSDLRQIIMAAGAEAGGGSLLAYLTKMALEQPSSYMSLLGRIIPPQPEGDIHNTFIITSITRRVIDPKEGDQVEVIEPAARLGFREQ